MARLMGIDYGTKRIGLSLSDEGGRLAFPREILPNDKKIFERLSAIIAGEKISEIIIGEADLIREEAGIFSNELKRRFKLPVHKQQEFLTTIEARRYQEGPADARAAALILQRYLDRKNLI